VPIYRAHRRFIGLPCLFVIAIAVALVDTLRDVAFIEVISPYSVIYSRDEGFIVSSIRLLWKKSVTTSKHIQSA